MMLSIWLLNSLLMLADSDTSSSTTNKKFNEHVVVKRNVFEIPSAYDYYNNACQSHCLDDETWSLSGNFNVNPCPKCFDKNIHAHEHCNNWSVIGSSS